MGLFNRNKATLENEDQLWAVLWNPQGVRDFQEKPIWREGTIKNVDHSGYFELKFDFGVMVCSSLKNLKRIFN